MDVEASVAHLADLVRDALSAEDLDRFAELLDPAVTWGAPGDTNPACRNRGQVLSWYRNGRDRGVRAQVTDVTAHRDRILVAMKVTIAEAPISDNVANRWQVLTVAGGRVTDIRGYEDHATAAAAAGIVD